MRRTIRFFVLMVLFVICLSVTAFAASGESLSVVVKGAGGEAVNILATDGIFYLPSAVDIKAVIFAAEGEMAYRSDDGKIAGTISKGEALDLTAFETEDERGCVCYRLSLFHSGKADTYTFYHEENLSSVFVTTSEGLSYIERNKENRDKKAKTLILTSEGDVEYSDDGADDFSEIKGRGNATFSYYKKPYQLKLAKKTALLGMEKAKTWILLAGYTDQTALHNALAFTLGDAIGIPFNIEYRFVNLYIDGGYRGLYMLCEKVQVDENRVDIRDLEKENEKANPDHDLEDFSVKRVKNGYLVENSILSYYTYCEGMASPEDITGGYLVELDNIRGTSEPCHFMTENGNVYVVKSPEYASFEEMEYIASLFADMEEAIFSADGCNKKGIHYSEYIDMESFAGIYTLQELLKNWDAYLGSMFFFKDADADGVRAKIYMGPLWDMDNTLGNINFNKEYGTDTAYLWAQNGVFNSYKRDFAKMLMSHEDFCDAVKDKFNEAYHEVHCYLALDGGLERAVEEIYGGVMMDRTRWKLYDGDSWLLNSSGYKTSVKFVQFEEYGIPQDKRTDTALGFFRHYLLSRTDALLHLIGSGVYEPSIGETTETENIQTVLPTGSEATTAETTVFTGDGSEDTSLYESSEDVDSSSEDTAVSSILWVSVAVVLIAAGAMTVFLFVRKKVRK